MPVDGRPQRAAVRAYRLRYLVNAYPALYLPLARVRHRDVPDWNVGRDCELVIEAFGRSGNTFAVLAFEAAQPRPVRSAHHSHAAAHVITAARRRIPTLVIVRRPADAALSHMVLRDIPPRPPLEAWIRFHRRILPYREHLLVSRFEEVTADFGAVIRRLNDRFGTSFAVWQHTPENVAAVFTQIEGINRGRPGAGESRMLALPTAERRARKEARRAELEAPDLLPLRRRADGLYAALVEQAPPPMDAAHVSPAA
jgi:hypothetical protein